MLYALYEDDGPAGPCGQAMSITSSWCIMYRFATYDELRDFRDRLSSSRSRRNMRIIGAWTDDENDGTGLDLIWDYAAPPAVVL